METQKITEAFLHFQGIKGRDRKAKYHTHTLSPLLVDWDSTAIVQEAKAYLSRNAKSYSKAKVTLHDGSLETFDGVQFKSINLMPTHTILL